MKTMRPPRPSGPTGSAPLPLPKSRRGIRGFFRETIREMRHVHWPTRQETNRLSGVVLTICAAAMLVLWLLSMFFDVIFRVLFRGGV
jgi:preprotein translocase SecE subunit